MPSNGAPRLSIAIAVPAWIFGLPRAAPSNSADAPAICSESAFAAASTSDWPRKGTSVATYTGSPNVLARSVGATPEPDSCAERVFAGAVPTSAFLLATSHPRTCTSLTCSAEVTTARKRTRSLPWRRSSGSACSLFGAGASVAGFGARNSNLPSLTATSCPISRASPSRNSQSETPPWLRWSKTVDVASTVPSVSPARWATFFATSDAVTCV